MEFTNTSDLNSEQLRAMFERHLDGWPHRSLTVVVRHTRSRPFSGLCDYRRKRFHINIGRTVQYPYEISTHLARAKSNARYWWKEIYRVRIRDAYQLALFVFLHELFHWLVKQAGRNTRRKESMCDRFAARILVEQYGATVIDRNGHPVERAAWDFQDLDRFVARARRLTQAEKIARRRPRKILVPAPVSPPANPTCPGGQLLLFPIIP